MNRRCFIETTLGVFLIFIGDGCRGEDINRMDRPANSGVGPANSGSGITQFLNKYRDQIKSSVDPQRLQFWAREMLSTLTESQKHKRIIPSQVPDAAVAAELKKSLISVSAIRASDEQTGHVCFVWGGGRGYYGIKVGNKDFRPADDKAHYLEWLPGIFLYFMPPI